MAEIGDKEKHSGEKRRAHMASTRHTTTAAKSHTTRWAVAIAITLIASRRITAAAPAVTASPASLTLAA
jgi:hypothetical protein